VQGCAARLMLRRRVINERYDALLAVYDFDAKSTRVSYDEQQAKKLASGTLPIGYFEKRKFRYNNRQHVLGPRTVPPGA
jgi:hypothetical protein